MAVLSEKTQQIYEQRLNVLRQHFPTPDRKWMANSVATIGYIESLNSSVNTKKLIYIALKSTLRDMKRKTQALKDAEKAYEEKMVSYNRQVNDSMQEQMKDVRESEQWLEWAEVLRARDKAIAEASTLEETQDAVILSLYTFLPPARLDFAPMAVVDEDSYETEPPGNLLVVAKKAMHFVFKEYKTAQRYGRKVVPIPHRLQLLLRDWLKMNHSGVLLLNSKGEPMTDVQLGVKLKQVLKKITGKNAGVNILRHSYISYVRKGEKPYKKQKEIADAMMHSVDMNQLYRKID
jgi:hypothetical protein